MVGGAAVERAEVKEERAELQAQRKRQAFELFCGSGYFGPRKSDEIHLSLDW